MDDDKWTVTKVVPIWATSRTVLLAAIDSRREAGKPYLATQCPACETVTTYEREDVPAGTTPCPHCGAPHIEYGEERA
jgi:PHP family Zn ribbon phosphoesterase